MSATLTAPVVLGDDVHAPQTGWARVVTAARVQNLGFNAGYLFPWVILASAFAINAIIFALVQTDAEGSTGGLSAIYIVVTISAMQTVGQFLPFSLGLGVTRRAFYGAALLAALVQALLYGAALTLLLGLENLTDGWGVDMRFFGIAILVAGNPVSQVLVYAAPFLLFGAVGLLTGAVQKRWGSVGIYTYMIVGVLVGGLLLAVAGWLDAWSAIGDFFSGAPVEVYAGLLPLAVAVVLAGAGWVIVRRTSI